MAIGFCVISVTDISFMAFNFSLTVENTKTIPKCACSQLEDAMEVDINRREGVTNEKVGQLEGAGKIRQGDTKYWTSEGRNRLGVFY